VVFVQQVLTDSARNLTVVLSATMQSVNGPETYPLPHQSGLHSPPTTPETPRSRNPSGASYTAEDRTKRRHGIISPIISPPDHLEPVSGYNFSYTPPQRDTSDSNSSEDESSEEDTASNTNDSENDADSEPEDPPERRHSIHTRAVDEEADFTVEELDEDDIGYDSETEVLYPFHCEDALSEVGLDIQELDLTLVEEFDSLNCHADPDPDPDQEKEREARQLFEEARHRKYLRKRQRWSVGGNHKRTHKQSIGSESDNEDIIPLDADQAGSSARRLRRRTEGPEDMPRRSLIFDDPPAEIEELRYMDNEEAVIEQDSDDAMLPTWFYPAMDVDSEED
jgi:hypothetical protein